MKHLIILAALLLSNTSLGETVLEPADIKNRLLAKQACESLGELCARYKRECEQPFSPMPNTCLATRYFELEVAKERCGNSRYLECDKENSSYRIKWMHELNLPNMGNPKRETAFRSCENVGMYHVKSGKLEGYANDLHAVFKYIREPIEDMGPPYYRDYKLYYECFERNL